MRRGSRRTLAGLAAGAVALATVGLAAGTSQAASVTDNLVVRDGDISTFTPSPTSVPATDWFINTDNQAGTGSAEIVNVVDIPNVRFDGALELDIQGPTDKIQVATDLLADSSLGEITSINYNGRTLGDPATLQPAFQIELFCAGTTGFTTLNYEPAYDTAVNGSLTVGDWKRFDALSSTAEWWSSRTINGDGTTAAATDAPTGTGGIQGGEANRRPFSDFATLCDDNGGQIVTYGVNAGSGWPTSQAQVDKIEVNGVQTDFGYDVASRIFGSDRYATAIDASQTAFKDGTADLVVLASGANFPDALAGVPLAAQGGPLLLTPPTTLPVTVKNEILRVLKAPTPDNQTGVVILGGTGAVSPAVETALKTALGASRVLRIGGSDRFMTALMVTDSIRGVLGSEFGPVFVADGLNFPDALSSGAAAGSLNGGVILSSATTLTPAVKTQLTTWKGQGTTIYGAGGNGAAAAGSLSSANFVGTDRYATSAKIALRFFDDASKVQDWGLANGLNFPDAMSGGAFVANAFGPILLTAPTALPGSIEAYLQAVHATLTDGWVFGGPAVVSDAAGTTALVAASGGGLTGATGKVDRTPERRAGVGVNQRAFETLTRSAGG